MNYDKTKFVSLFLSTLVPLISYELANANGINYNPMLNRLEIHQYCKPNFKGATLAIKALNGNKDQVIAENIHASKQEGCFSIIINTVTCEKIRIYATYPAEINGQFYLEDCATTANEAPKKTQADLEKVRNEAENKGKFYANRIADAYDAKAANYAYNFIIGVQAEENLFANSPHAQSAKMSGYNAGKSKGVSPGKLKGEDDGNTLGSSRGTLDVTGQYRSRLDSPEDKNWAASKDSKIPSYTAGSFPGGLNTNYLDHLSQDSAAYISGLPSSLRQAIMDHNNNFHVKLDLFNLLFAFDNFKSQYPEQTAYYQNLSQHENAAEAQRLYESVFTQEYTDIVDDKILKEIKKQNDKAQADGFNAAKEALVHVTYNKGFNEGYEAAAKEAAAIAFNSAYTKSYQTAFDNRVKYLNNNAEIEGIVTSIVDSDKKQEFVIGQPVTLIINEFANIGRKGGTFEVTLSESINATTTIEIKGSSRAKNVEFKDIANISPSSKLGQQPVQICIDDKYCSKQNIELKWENQIKGLTKTGVSEKASNDIALFIRGVLLDEWKEIYKSNPDPSPNSTKASPYDKLGKVYDKKINQYVSGLVDYPKSKLGLFEKAITENLKVPGFKEKIQVLGEDYMRMKHSMLSPEAAARSLIDGFATAKVKVSEAETADLLFSKMTEAQQKEAMQGYADQQNQLFAWASADAIRTKQLSGCISKVKNQEVSCIGFMTATEALGNNYRTWGLGHKQMNNILKMIKAVPAAAASPLKK